MIKLLLSTLTLTLLVACARAQNVGIGTTAPDASSLLELKSTTRGFLPPRMTAAEKALVAAPKAGLMIYQTDGSKGLYIYTGTAWESVANAGTVLTGWSVTGNTGTNPATSFIGTTDNQPLKFRVNNLPSGLIDYNNLNVGLGAKALSTNIGGVENTAVGHTALALGTNGNSNSAFGVASLAFNTDGSRNTALGGFSLRSNTQGHENTAAGYNALYLNTTGNTNTSNGAYAMYFNLTGYSNVALGAHALYRNSVQSNNVAIGDSSLLWNGLDAETASEGTQNVAVGSKTMMNNRRGWANTAVGFEALSQNSGGKFSTAIGDHALYSNTSGENNTALGYNALRYNLTGESNIGIGNFSLADNNEGSNNVALGQSAMGSNTNGTNNIAIGSHTLNSNTIGSGNTSVGYNSMSNNLSGSNNTALGTRAEVGAYDLMVSNATAIGSNALALCNNCMTLGSHALDNQVKVGIGMDAPQAILHIKQSGDPYPVNGQGLRIERAAGSNHWELGIDLGNDFDFTYNGAAKSYIQDQDGQYVVVSDARMKKDVSDVQPVLSSLMQLRPKTYHYKDNLAGTPLSYGFIAQEVEPIFPSFVSTKGPDKMKAVAYQNFTIVAVKAIQEQQAMIVELTKQLDATNRAITEQARQFQEQMNQLKLTTESILHSK